MTGSLNGSRALRDVFSTARRALAQGEVADPGFEARCLIQQIADVPTADFVARPEQLLPAEHLRQIDAALARRAAGEPLHRILGWREFYGMRLALSAETLEPRPDTETLVDAVLPLARDVVRRESICRILDLGTGTGAIALALLRELDGAQAVGVDISEDALRTAANNAAHLGLEKRFQVLHSDWFEEISGRFHFIVANPPYISRQELAALPAAVARFDPVKALDGGPDGLDAYRRIADGAAAHLEGQGRVAVEIGYRQKDSVREIFEANDFATLAAHRDFGGNDRVLVFETREEA